ncbi:hypothetical protein ABGB07_27225 [Micromonosporaceae bacterium B7E4]
MPGYAVGAPPCDAARSGSATGYPATPAAPGAPAGAGPEIGTAGTGPESWPGPQAEVAGAGGVAGLGAQVGFAGSGAVEAPAQPVPETPGPASDPVGAGRDHSLANPPGSPGALVGDATALGGSVYEGSW